MPMTEEAKERNRALISVYCYGRPGTIKDPARAQLMSLEEAIKTLAAQVELPGGLAALRIALTDLCRTFGNAKEEPDSDVHLPTVGSKITYLAEVMFSRMRPSAETDKRVAFWRQSFSSASVPAGGENAYNYALTQIIQSLPEGGPDRLMSDRFVSYHEGQK